MDPRGHGTRGLASRLLLPTVAGGLLAAGGAAAFNWTRLSELMFGFGFICWVVLGSILLLRLFTQPALPNRLLPFIASNLRRLS
jgi:tellurite resistance protein